MNWRSYNDLATHAADLLKEIDARHPRRLIIDMQVNRGGNFNLGRAFISEIAPAMARRPRRTLHYRGAQHLLCSHDQRDRLQDDNKCHTRWRTSGRSAQQLAGGPILHIA